MPEISNFDALHEAIRGLGYGETLAFHSRLVGALSTMVDAETWATALEAARPTTG